MFAYECFGQGRRLNKIFSLGGGESLLAFKYLFIAVVW